MSIEVLEWPAEDTRRCELEKLGRPRLLVINAEVAAPVVSDALEDWIRKPFPGSDLQARLDGLQARRSAEPALQPLAEVDNDGMLRTSVGWVALSEVEAKIMTALVDRFGTVVDRELLQTATWPGQEVSRNLLDVYLHKLRPKVTAVGVEIVTIRKRGVLLDVADAGSP